MQYSTVCIVYVLILCLRIIFCLCICVYVLVLFCCIICVVYLLFCINIVWLKTDELIMFNLILFYFYKEKCCFHEYEAHFFTFIKYVCSNCFSVFIIDFFEFFNNFRYFFSVLGSDNGSFESFSDSVLMIQSSPQLQNLVLAFVFTVTIYNCKKLLCHINYFLMFF